MCYLEHMTVGDLVCLVLPCLMEGAHETLLVELERHKALLEPDLMAKRVPVLYDLVCKYSREYWSASAQASNSSNNNKAAVALPKWKYVIHELRQLENLVARLRVLCQKLDVSVVEEEEVEAEDGADGGALIRGLMSGRPTVVAGGPDNKRSKEILQLFSPTQADVVSDYILFWNR